MLLATILVAILAFVPLARITAQEPPPVKVGDPVRVAAPDLSIGKQAGSFVALRADTLVVAVADSTMTFPAPSVTRLEVSRGQASISFLRTPKQIKTNRARTKSRRRFPSKNG